MPARRQADGEFWTVDQVIQARGRPRGSPGQLVICPGAPSHVCCVTFNWTLKPLSVKTMHVLVVVVACFSPLVVSGETSTTRVQSLHFTHFMTFKQYESKRRQLRGVSAPKTHDF